MHTSFKLFKIGDQVLFLEEHSDPTMHVEANAKGIVLDASKSQKALSDPNVSVSPLKLATKALISIYQYEDGTVSHQSTTRWSGRSAWWRES